MSSAAKNSSRVLRLPVMVAVLSLCVMLSIAAPVQQAEPARQSFNPATGFATFIGYAPQNTLRLDAAGAAPRSLSALAQEAAAQFAPMFGVSLADGSQLVLLEEGADDGLRGTGGLTARFGQTYQGVPVFGAELLVNLTRDGGISSVNGKLSPNLNLSVTPTLAVEQATATANLRISRTTGLPNSALASERVALNIYDRGLHIRGTASEARLAWLIETHGPQGAPLHQVTLVDAESGAVLLTYNSVHADVFAGTEQARTPQEIFAPWADAPARLPLPEVGPLEAAPRVLGSPDLATYTANNWYVLPGTLLCTESKTTCTASDTDANKAHKFARGTYQFYANQHNRDSLNDGGMQMKSSVHFFIGFCNAFWTGKPLNQMVYGDGCNIVLDDVVAHELTHGVTDYESGLVYAYESGAINEALSDIWGETYDLTNNTGEDKPANRWVIGEELIPGGIRNMKNPTLLGDPDRLQSPNYWLRYDDLGGVHINSGVANKAVYLMIDGNIFNGYEVIGIGIKKTLAIWYRVQTMLLSKTADYNDLYDALNQACADLTGTLGITSANCQQVQNALMATEMHLTSPMAPVTAELCEIGLPNYLYRADFESSSPLGWTLRGMWGLWDTQVQALPPLDGSFSLHGVNGRRRTDNTATQNDAVDLPVHTTSYLHFWHDYAFEVGGYDGGLIEYSVNDGPWKMLKNTMLDSGEGYVSKLVKATLGNDSALAGKKAFGNSSFGINKERYQLAEFAGKNIRFRFRIATDSTGAGGRSWVIDNVSIYTCYNGAPPVAPQDLSATQQGAGVLLTWSDTALLDDRYVLMRDDGVNNAEVQTLNETVTSHHDPFPECGQSYTYTLRVVNGAGEELSNAVQVDSPPCPVAPGDLAVELIGYQQFQVTWTDTASGDDVYVLHRTGGTTGEQLFTDIPPGSSSIINGAPCKVVGNVTYTYTLEVISPFGTASSNSVTVPAVTCVTSLLLNGDFSEGGSYSLPKYWSSTGTGISPRRTCLAGRSSYVCQVYLSVKDYNPITGLKQVIKDPPVVAGDNLMLSVSSRTVLLTVQPVAQAVVKYPDGSKQKIRLDLPLTVEWTWNYTQQTLTGTPDKIIVQLTAQYGGTTNGRAHFSRMRLDHLPAPPRGVTPLALPDAPDGFRGGN